MLLLLLGSISPVARLVEEEPGDSKAEHQPQHIAVVNEGDDDEEEGAQNADDALFLAVKNILLVQKYFFSDIPIF